MSGFGLELSGRLRPTSLELDISHPLSRGMIGCWPLGDRGQGCAVDYSPSNWRGTYVGSPPLINYPHGGYAHSGVAGAYVNCGSRTISGAFSVVAWARRDWTTGAYNAAWGLNLTGTSGKAFVLSSTTSTDWIAKDILLFGDGFNGGRSPRAIAAIPALTANTWHMFAGVLGPSNADIYVNKTLLSNRVGSAATVPSSTGTMTLASQTTLPDNPFVGGLAMLRLYNRPLTAQDIAWLYDEPFAGITPRPRKFYLVRASTSGGTLSGAFTESNDSAAIAARVRVAGSLSRTENADSVAVQARLRVAGSVGVQDAADHMAASGSASEPETPELGFHYHLLAHAAARRVTPDERLRSIRAFPRTRLLAA